MKAQTFELNRCYNADCMKAMAAFPDGYFDLAVVDPPYFSGPERRGFYGSRVSRIGVHRDYPVSPVWEVPGKEYFDELMRVSRHYIIWGCNYFSYGFAPGRIVWDKCNQATSFSDCEIAATDLLKTVRLFRYMWSGMMQGKSISEGHIMQGNKSLNEVRVHPTQKPIVLYDMAYTVEQIAAVMQETRSNFEQFLGWSEDGEMVAYEKLRRVVEDIYGVGAMVERVKGQGPIFGSEF